MVVYNWVKRILSGGEYSSLDDFILEKLRYVVKYAYFSRAYFSYPLRLWYQSNCIMIHEEGGSKVVRENDLLESL